MSIHPIGSRGWNRFWLVIFLLFLLPMTAAGPIVFLIHLARIAGWTVSPPEETFAQAMFFTLFWSVILISIAAEARQITSIQVTDIGTASFQRTIGSTTVPVSTISQLEGRYVRDCYDNKQVWHLIIWGLDGKFEIGGLSDPRVFADRIVGLNPAVEITGLWPIGPT